MQFRFHPNIVIRRPSNSLSALPSDTAQLRKACNTSFFLDALYCSSTSLFKDFEKWINDPITNKNDRTELVFSIYRYYIRSMTRCTPFGLFANCSVGTWGSRSMILFNQSDIRHEKRLDMEAFVSIVQGIKETTSLFKVLKYYPNSSIYQIGNTLRYVEFHYESNNGGTRIHDISSVTRNVYLDAILDFAKHGKTYSEILHLLMTLRFPASKSKFFVQEIIEKQLLVDELTPVLTGGDNSVLLKQVLSNPTQLPSSEKLIIQSWQSLIEDILIQDLPIYKSTEQFYSKAATISSRPISELKRTALLHIDSFSSNIIAELDERIQKKILLVIPFLKAITPRFHNSLLEKFKEKFIEKYGDKEISLLEALDPESGVGYPPDGNTTINHFIEGLNIQKKDDTLFSSPQTRTENFLLNKLSIALKQGNAIVKFTKEDIKNFPADKVSSLAPTMSVIFRVLNSKESKIQIKAIGGLSSALNILGRFVYGSQRIKKITSDIAWFENSCYPDRILAEIVHLPVDRGNILCRTVLRDYEIPYLARSGIKFEKQIPARDILVSVKNNRIVIKSRSFNKEIIPRLGNAHNYTKNSVPAYRFLCDLQMQDIDYPGLSFNWGNTSASFCYLPRAEYEDVVIFPASWNFSSSVLRKAMDATSASETMQSVDIWRKKWEIPQYVSLIEGDMELLIDLDNELSVLSFLSSVRKKKSFSIAEFLYDFNNSLTHDVDGGIYTSEIIATIFNQEFSIGPPAILLPQDVEKKECLIPSIFSPGSQWLYCKIYCGEKTADNLLTHNIKNPIEYLNNIDLIDSWFFIRYSDPLPHIRLRFYNLNTKKNHSVLKIVSEFITPLMESGEVLNFVLDTYKREIERYGCNTIELTERYFCVDSQMTLSLLEQTKFDSEENLRWKYAIITVNDLFNLLRFTDEEKLDFLSKLADSFIVEHGADKDLKLWLGEKFRDLRSQLTMLFSEESCSKEQTLSAIFQIATQKKHQTLNFATTLLELKNSNELMVSFEDYLSALIHMTMNRIFTAKQRTHEMIIYDLMRRYYKSKIAQNKDRAGSQ